MNLMGRLYQSGNGVTEDQAAAVAWFRKAADLGEAGAFNILGDCYESGRGCVQDQAEAERLHEKARELGIDW
jgi:TPR repeat protein